VRANVQTHEIKNHFYFWLPWLVAMDLTSHHRMEIAFWAIALHLNLKR
jgi:hypothetical protein